MSEITRPTKALAVLAFLIISMIIPTVQVHADEDLVDESVEAPTEEGISRTSVVTEFNVSVTFKYEANKPELLNFQEAMKLFSRSLYDASEGAFRLRNVDIWTNMKNAGSSEIVIENEGGYYRAWTNRGGIDLPYSQVHLGKSAYGAQWNQPQGTNTILHEWGHFALYLPDEYEDVPDGHGGNISIPWCHNCIMSDGNFTEYCGVWNHNYTNPNAEAKSCWEQIVEHYPGAAANEPKSEVEVEQNGPVYNIPAEDPNIVLHVADMCVTAQDLTLIGTPTTGDTTTLYALVHNLDGLLASNDLEIEVFDGPRGDNKFITGSSKVVMQ